MRCGERSEARFSPQTRGRIRRAGAGRHQWEAGMMATPTHLSFVDRLLQALQHPGIERTHLAGAVASDWRGLAATHAHRLASLSLVCPAGFDPRAVATIG